MAQRNAAGQIWPNLQSDEQPKQQRAQSSLASAMYPRPQAKPPNPHRESLLRHLKEANAAIDARLKGGR
jgi:hypothetical protein